MQHKCFRELEFLHYFICESQTVRGNIQFFFLTLNEYMYAFNFQINEKRKIDRQLFI